MLSYLEMKIHIEHRWFLLGRFFKNFIHKVYEYIIKTENKLSDFQVAELKIAGA